MLCWRGAAGAETYVVDDTGSKGRVFDGIGGLSGGGVSLHCCLVSMLAKNLLNYLSLCVCSAGHFSTACQLP